MNKELILKLLKSLGVKIGEKEAEGEIKEDVAIKLVEDLFNASNLVLLKWIFILSGIVLVVIIFIIVKIIIKIKTSGFIDLLKNKINV